MLTETQEIADLFRNPRKVHRTLPFKKFASHTYGKGKLAQPGGGGYPDPSPDPDPSPGPDADWDV
tara:strand:- start:65 stop:259 length:195 start_codon:yes stop_codon:yes gene_type:complete